MCRIETEGFVRISSRGITGNLISIFIHQQEIGNMEMLNPFNIIAPQVVHCNHIPGIVIVTFKFKSFVKQNKIYLCAE